MSKGNQEGFFLVTTSLSPVASRMMATARDTGSSGSLRGSFLDFGGFWPWGPLGMSVFFHGPTKRSKYV